MKFQKTKNRYVASNVVFDVSKREAFSYGWWKFVKVDAYGQVIFNSYKYSKSTQGHQRKVRSLLKNLGIEIDVEINQRESLT